jgi:hypothetical protein
MFLTLLALRQKSFLVIMKIVERKGRGRKFFYY